jgi:hypothetical protein
MMNEVIPSEVEAATQPPEAARPGFPSRCENEKLTPRGPSTSLSLRSGSQLV